MRQAIRSFWGNYFNFSGRATRTEYWLYFLLYFVVSSFVIGIPASSKFWLIKVPFSIIGFIWVTVHFIGFLSLVIRRLHDSNKSGWWLLLCILLSWCFVGEIMFVVLMVLPSSIGNNRFGPERNYGNNYGNGSGYNNNGYNY